MLCVHDLFLLFLVTEIRAQITVASIQSLNKSQKQQIRLSRVSGADSREWPARGLVRFFFCLMHLPLSAWTPPGHQGILLLLIVLAPLSLLLFRLTPR